MTRNDQNPLQKCCIPSLPAQENPAKDSVVLQKDGPLRLCDLPPGIVLTGSKAPVFHADGEHLRKRHRIGPISVAPHTVTNAEFTEFVESTGYTTDAESLGSSLVFHLDIPNAPKTDSWWVEAKGASWHTPMGLGSNVIEKPDHPVVHVSHNDAMAYADWCDARLPSEAEWEYAAKGGAEDPIYPWGDADPETIPKRPLNIWRGSFPDAPRKGTFGTQTVQGFEPNGHGLYQMVGNVWEWTACRFKINSLSKGSKRRNVEAAKAGEMTLKGGSFLCHRSYCWRYRIAARSGASANTSAAHIGMRILRDRGKLS